MSTVLTDSGVLYVTDDGKHIIQADVRRERRAASQRHQPAAAG